MEIPAYLARPANAKPGAPGVVVAFEMFGLTGYVRRVADWFAALGYPAIAPDFYHRLGDRIELPATAEGRADGLALLRRLDRAGVVADVAAAIDQLDAARVAAVGMSVGGHLAYYAASQLRLDALAVFYPGWLTSTEFPIGQPVPTIALTPGLARNGTRTLILTGADDHLVDAADRAAITAALEAAGVEHELVVYPDTPHGYFCDERETYRPDQAADSWDRITALLDATLRPTRTEWPRRGAFHSRPV